ncbi:MAG TPA: ATP-binding protein [Thermomicrobiales bacterium]|nr:ATP-binding protein [Thermomicrobiales bacterium]
MQEQTELMRVPAVRDDLFRLLVESVRDYAIFHLDPQGYIQSWNEGARRIKGYEASEIIGRHFSTFYLPHEARHGKPAYELAVASDEGRWEEEGWRLRKDGTRFWASVVITALYNPEGEVVGFAKVTRDLTERKRSEEERSLLLDRERQAREAAEEAVAELRTLQSLTETALTHLNLEDVIDELLDRIQRFLEVDTVVVLLMDQETNVLVPLAAAGIEPEARTLMHIPAGRGLAGKITREQRPIIINDVRQEEILDPALREVGIRSWLGVPLLAENNVLGVLHVGALHHRNFGAREERFLQIVGDRLALAIDRAHLMKAEQEARIDAEAADAKLRAQDAFLAIAAHELRSPTASVKTAVQLLMRRVAGLADSELEALLPVLETANQQTDRLTRLVDKLIESARIDSRQIGLEFVHTNVVALVNETAELTRASVADQHEITVSGPEELWAWVDPVRLGEVVSNLLENAIKHGESERIEVQLNQPDDEVFQLVVRDYGAGVPIEHRPHLFKRFYQGSGGGMGRGLGLGLYICREVVAAHGGDIVADFPDDGGTRFTATFPLKASSDAASMDQEL